MSEFIGTKKTEYMDGRDLQTGTLAKGTTLNAEFTRLYDNDNWLKAQQDAHAASAATDANRIHGIRQGSGNGFDADKVDGMHAGNATGNIPVSNGTLCTDLNADRLDGQHGVYYAAAADLASHASSAITSSNSMHGIKQGSGNSFDADTVDGWHAGNSAGNIPVANGSLCTDLNADRLDGLHSGEITPVGTITAYMTGYFTGSSNGGFTAVTLPLPANWRLCDGSECNDASSPVFNGAGRYLPNLTDSRFIMGSTVSGAGQFGGNAGNQVTLAVGHLPSHNHTIGHVHSTISGSAGGGGHQHGITLGSSAEGSPLTGPTWSSRGNEHGFKVAYTDGSSTSGGEHNHSISGSTGGSDTPNSGYAGSGTAFDIRPKYLSAAYIIRIK